MDSLSSLRALFDATSSNVSGPVCVPASDLFWDYISGGGKSSDLAEAFESCLSVKPNAPRGIAFDALLGRARQGVAGDNEFPGPMCSPLRRLHLGTFRPDEYTFTEKSDGIRTIVVVVTCRGFPLWAHSSGDAVSSNLFDVVRLEKARKRLDNGADDSTVCEVAQLAGCTERLRLSRAIVETVSGEAQSFTCAIVDKEGQPVGEPVTVTRSLGAVPIAFVLDRAMDNFYVLCHGPDRFLADAAVFDGELMATCLAVAAVARAPPPPRFVLGLFDVFSYCRAEGDAGAAVSLASHSMPDRYHALQSLIPAPEASCLTDATSAPRGRHVVTIHWFVKTMWRCSQFSQCLEHLHFDQDGRFHYFAHPRGWCTRNDGFVFTPDSFPVVSGASASQLKWKWKRSLSVDWRVRAHRPGGDLYDMFLFFRKKRFGHQPDTVGHWKLPRPWELDNPHGFVISTKPSEATVVECVFDVVKRRWTIERLRRDKTQANSITTAISVMESLAEDLDLPTLLRELRVTDAPALARAAALEKVEPQDTDVPLSNTVARPHKSPPPLTAPFSVRAVSTPSRDRSFYLYWCTNATGNPEFTRTIPAPLCRVRDCVGLGTGAGSVDANGENEKLEALLSIELANAGGSYGWSDFIVDACFNGLTGRWEVVRTRPYAKGQMASFEHAIMHLRTLVEMGGSDAARRALPQDSFEVPPSLQLIAAASRDIKTAVTNAHYGEKARELSTQSGERSALRQFHNWIKSMLISEVVATGKQRFTGHVFILDVCCGRGGDLHKWKAAHPDFLFMTDASVECVAEAAARYNVSEGMSLKAVKGRLPGFAARFAVHDAFDPTSSLRADLMQVRRERGHGFAVASCQFSMHYACRSMERLACFVETVATCLGPGGLFTGTTVSDTAILQAFKNKGRSFACETYGIRFPEATAAKLNEWVQTADSPPEFNSSATPPLPFGLEYYITIEDTVSDLPEYVVPWEAFVQLCASFSLALVLDTAFESFYHARKDTPEGRERSEVMFRKRDRAGTPKDLDLSEEEKEAAALYRAFVFEKRP